MDLNYFTNFMKYTKENGNLKLQRLTGMPNLMSIQMESKNHEKISK